MDAQPISKRHVHGSDKGWRRRCLFVKEINEYFRLSKQEKRYDDPAPLHGVEARELGLEVRLTPAQLEAARLEAARQEPVQLEYQHYGRPRAPFPGGPNLHDDPDQVSWGNNTYRPTGVRGVIANKDLRGSDLKLAIMETLLRQEHGQRYGQHHQRSRDYRSPHGGRRDYTNKGQVPQSYSNRDLDKVGYDERDRLYKLDSECLITSTYAFYSFTDIWTDYGLGNDYDDGVDYSEGAYLIQDGSTHLPQANSGSLPTRTVSQASSATSHCTVPPNYELGKARTVSQASSSTTLKHTVPTNYEFAKARTLPRAETVPRAPSLTTSQHTIPTNYEFGKVRTFPPSVTSQQDSHRPTILHTLNPPPINAPPKRQVAAGNSIQNLNNPSSTTSSVPANQITSGNGSRYVTIGERAMQMFTHDSDASSIMSRTSSPEFLPLQAQKIPAKVVFQREPSAPIQIDIQPQLDDSSASVSVQAVNPRSKWRALREVELMSYEEAEAPRATRSQKLKH